MTTSSEPQTVFSVSRNLFRDFLQDLVDRLNKTYPLSDNSSQANRWRRSGIGHNSKWKDIIVFVDNNQNTYKQQTGPTVIRKLVKLLPVIGTFYDITYHTNGRATLIVKTVKEDKDAKTTPTPVKQESPRNPTAPVMESGKLAISKNKSTEPEDDDNQKQTVTEEGTQATLLATAEGTHSATTTDKKKEPPQDSWKVVEKGPKPQEIIKAESNFESRNPFEAYTQQEENQEEEQDQDENYESGISYDNEGNELSSTSSDTLTKAKPTPRGVKLRSIQEVYELISIGRTDACTVEELSNFVQDQTKRVHNNTTIVEHKLEEAHAYTKVTLTRMEDRIISYKDMAKLHTDTLNEIGSKWSKEVKKIGEETILENMSDLDDQYEKTLKEMKNCRMEMSKFRDTIDSKMEFFDSIGDLVTQTETTLLTRITEMITQAEETVVENLGNTMDKFESDITNLTQSELEALHKEGPEEVMNDILNRVTKLEQGPPQVQRNNDDFKTIIEQLQNQVKTLQQQVNALQSSRAPSPPTQDTPDQEVHQQQQPNPRRMFQPPPPRTNDMNQIDDGQHPSIPISALIDYQQGVMKLHNIRILDAYKGANNTWRYIAVTINNTIVKDLSMMHMTNIRTLDPEPLQNSSSFRASPSMRQSTEIQSPTPTPTTSSTLHQRQRRSRPPLPSHREQYSDDESTASDVILVYNSHQYRYPKQSQTMSRVNYSYITDKGSKWNIKLESEDKMKPFYDKLVNRMTEAGVLLKPWESITKGTNLSVINTNNCENYENAYKCMAQALYNYLDDNKDTIFHSYSIPKGYIEGYRSLNDGFKVLYETLSANHPALVDLIDSREDPTKPTLEMHDNNIYTFCNALKNYYDYEYKGLSDRPTDHKRKVIKYIKAQLATDDRYEKAISYIDTELKRIYADSTQPLPFPNELTLEGTVAVTLMRKIPRDVYTDINHSITQNSQDKKYSINTTKDRAQKQGRTRGKSMRSSLYDKLKQQKDKSSKRSATDEICRACGESGHDVLTTGCDKLAQYELLMRWLDKNKNSEKIIQKATRQYQKHQRERHSKRNFSKEVREYKHSIKTFHDQHKEEFDIESVKQMFLATYREEIDPTAPEDIFDDVKDTKTTDEQDGYDSNNTPDEISDDDNSTTSQE